LYVNFNNDNLLTTADYKIAINAASTATASIVDGDVNFVITGGTSADVIIAGGGADTITGGAGADAITGGAGNDVFIIVGSAQAVAGNAAIDLIDGGAGTLDEVRLSTATTIAATDLLARITNVEKITSDANAGIISITITAADGTLTGTSFTTIDLSGDTDATANNVISVTGVTTISTITGSAGIDTITIGAAAVANTITGGLGVDVLSLGATLASTIVVGTLDTGATYATADKITGFSTTVDKLSLGAAGVTANFATANGAADEATALAAANTAMNGTVKYYLATAIAANLGGGAGAESLLYIDADMDGTLDDLIVLVGTAGVVVAGDIIA
jgi:Ca2+-binding RTX toxin-like protein